jgi:hypothetical protein
LSARFSATKIAEIGRRKYRGSDLVLEPEQAALCGVRMAASHPDGNLSA